MYVVTSSGAFSKIYEVFDPLEKAEKCTISRKYYCPACKEMRHRLPNIYETH